MTTATTAGSTILMTPTPVFGLRTGATLPIAASATVPSKLTVCMPLISSVFGLGADKMLPIGLLGDDIRIEITFESLIQSMIYDGGSSQPINWQVTNVEPELCIIELSDVVMAMVNSVTPFNQPIYLHGNSWRHCTSSLNANSSGTYSTLVPARFC